MNFALTFKDFMGALAVAITLVACGIYVRQTLRGETRPHPLSWLIFGILTGTAYLVQRDEAAGAGSWVMGVTAVVCLLLCVMSLWRGDSELRSFRKIIRKGRPPPSPQRGEGWGEGFGCWSFFSSFRTPSSCPSPP
jgi:hypothetical protein